MIRGQYRVRRFYRDISSPGPFTFALGGGHDLRVAFRPADEEDSQGKSYDALVEATATWGANDRVQAAFESMADGRIPEGSTGSQGEWEIKYLDDDGRVPPSTVYPFGLLPESVQDFSRGVRREMSEAVTRCVELLRWRHGLRMSHDPVRARFPTPKWSLDGEEWRTLPVQTYMSIEGRSLLGMDDDTRQAVMDLIEAERSEPLAHQLLWEAQDVQGTHPRSALVIGMAALENGVKDFLVRVDPSEGLRRVLERLPAPSVATFFTAILPGLPTPRGSEKDPATFPRLPDGLTETIKKANDARNQVVHVWTSETVDAELVERSLKAVRDLLYLMDYYGEEDWALRHVRDETLAEMDLRVEAGRLPF